MLGNFWDILTMKGAGRLTVDTNSTFRVPLKLLGHNDSNQLCGRLVASKLSVHEPGERFFADGKEIFSSNALPKKF